MTDSSKTSEDESVVGVCLLCWEFVRVDNICYAPIMELPATCATICCEFCWAIDDASFEECLWSMLKYDYNQTEFACQAKKVLNLQMDASAPYGNKGLRSLFALYCDSSSVKPAKPCER